jgi:hypothetical protein
MWDRASHNDAHTPGTVPNIRDTYFRIVSPVYHTQGDKIVVVVSIQQTEHCALPVQLLLYCV